MALAVNSRFDELKASDKLPSPTGVGLSILQLTRDANTSSDELAEVLQRDPALAGQILKFANSAQARSKNDVTTVNDAVVRLGLSMVRNLALGFSVLSNARSGPCEAFDYTNYWTRSLAVAVGCRVLAGTFPHLDPEEAFTCGLLGQIGRLCLASVHPEEYSAALQEWNLGAPAELIALERERFSIDHNQAGAGLFEHWGLPEKLQIAVEQQEDPDWDEPIQGAGSTSLARLLNVASAVADVCVTCDERRDLHVREMLRRGEKLGLTEDLLIASSDAVLAEWSRLGQALEIITLAVPPMGELVERARRSEGETEIAATEATPGSRDRLRILVVDDDPGDCQTLETKLSAEGHEVATASSGAEALQVALQCNPQLILTDWLMPEMDGLELCQALRSNRETARIHVIVQTELKENDRLVEAFAAGVDDFLVKPVDPRVLLARLSAAQRVIGLHEQVEQDREEIRRFVAQLGVANRKLERLALYDQLTSLPNRRYAIDRLDEEWERTGRDEQPLLVMLLDIDHFKKVNDTYGHDAGDVVLAQTAAVMKSCMRTSDVVCRFGGEEFLVICPNANLQVATELGDRIRSAVEANAIDVPEFKGGVTISVGVAVRTADTSSPKDLIKWSDEALYAAKEAGRNKVCIMTGE